MDSDGGKEVTMNTYDETWPEGGEDRYLDQMWEDERSYYWDDPAYFAGDEPGAWDDPLDPIEEW